MDLVGKAHALLETLSEHGHAARVEEVIAQLLPEVERLTSTAKACALLGKPRASLYRQRNRPAGPRRKPGPSGPPPNALDAAERTQILTVLCQPRFADKAVARGPSCSTRASTCARSPRCTGSCARTT
ncbi:hypothetical protein MLAC_30910 [Mycobacterium lacus]|uniref:Uncharacterized protein n=1 Tax=Mycobacterium lacus TaxID=169765 RepID=A0A7I7NQK3_9MYCO|nr:hypothetical protein MLAC_30910 [Mycobacterium lacus]